MKILHLIGGGDVGGAKIHVLSLIKELDKNMKVKLVALRPGLFEEEASVMGIDVEVINSNNIIKDIRKVYEIFKTGEYDILHSHGAKANMISAIIDVFLSPIKAVTTVHSDYRLDYIQDIFKRVSFGFINTISLRFIKYHIGVSDNFSKMLVKRKFNPDNIFTVYNGINFDEEVGKYSRGNFCKKHDLDIRDEDVVFGILARLHPVKNIATFLYAAKEVLKENKNAKFVVGGDGEERKYLEKLSHQLKISENVFFPGWINDSSEFMYSIDVNVMTSLSESFPYTMLEGTRFKKPIISTDVGGISDLVENDKNGFLFTPKDYKSLSKYMLRFVNDKSLITKMGNSIYSKASKKFSLIEMAKTQISIYEKIEKSEKNENIKKNAKCTYDVIISGYYGFKNVGDDAMLLSIINSLRVYKEGIRIVVLSKNPKETKANYGVEAIYRFNIIKVLQIMKITKLFINGGGSLIQDNTSTRSLVYYLGLIWLAKKINMKVMLYANGIGPLYKKANRRFARAVLEQVDMITLREEMSLQELKRLAVKKPDVRVTADPALTIDVCDGHEIEDIFAKESIGLSSPIVGFAIRQWGKRRKYEKILAKVADYMIEKYLAKVVFIPMHKPHDLNATLRIVKKMEQKGYVIHDTYSASQIMGIISRFDLLIGMRLHALVFAASVGIPVVGLVYEPKIDGFMHYIKQISAGHVDNLDFYGLKSILDDVWTNRDSLKNNLKVIVEMLKIKSLENAKLAVDMLEECNNDNEKEDRCVGDRC